MGSLFNDFLSAPSRILVLEDIWSLFPLTVNFLPATAFSYNLNLLLMHCSCLFLPIIFYPLLGDFITNDRNRTFTLGVRWMLKFNFISQKTEQQEVFELNLVSCVRFHTVRSVLTCLLMAEMFGGICCSAASVCLCKTGSGVVLAVVLNDLWNSTNRNTFNLHSDMFW